MASTRNNFGESGIVWVVGCAALLAWGCGESSCPAGSVSMGERCVDERALQDDGGWQPDQGGGVHDGAVVALDAGLDAALDAGLDATAAVDGGPDVDSACPTGFEAGDDGCERNPCLASDDEAAACDPNATCTRDASGVECVCNDGYLGDGATCVKDGCAPEPGVAPACGVNETCTPDAEGAPSCACAAGFADCNEAASDGCEITLADNPAHCGACGFACAEDLACSAGTCQQRVTHIGIGWGTGLFRKTNGDLLGAGVALSANPASSRTPVKVTQTGVLRAYPYFDHTCAVRGDTQSALCWGVNGAELQLGAASTGATSFELGEPARAICAGDNHSCMVTLAGTVRCWGSGISGAFGNNTNYTTPSPRSFSDSHPVLNVTGATDVVCGKNLNCALTGNGRVYCWGTDATNDTDYPPELVRDEAGTALDEVVVLSGGNDHACAARKDGTAVCWGEGGNGRLGGPVPAVRNRYVTVPLTEVKSVSAGGLHSCALLSDGSVYCWGGGANGGLGSGDSADQPVPVEPLLPDGYVATAIYSGPLFAGACVTLTTGQVYCWGYDYYGQLGVNGQETFQATPVEVTAWP